MLLTQGSNSLRTMLKSGPASLTFLISIKDLGRVLRVVITVKALGVTEEPIGKEWRER